MHVLSRFVWLTTCDAMACVCVFVYLRLFLCSRVCLCVCVRVCNVYLCVFMRVQNNNTNASEIFMLWFHIVKMESAKTCAPILHMNNFFYYLYCSLSFSHSGPRAFSFARDSPFDSVCGNVLFFVFRFPVQQAFYRSYTIHTNTQKQQQQLAYDWLDAFYRPYYVDCCCLWTTNNRTKCSDNTHETKKKIDSQVKHFRKCTWTCNSVWM